MQFGQKSQRRRTSTQKLTKKLEEVVELIRGTFADDLARRAQKAVRLRNLKELYATTKRLSGKYQQEEKPIKDKQLKRWDEHFRELLNRSRPDDPLDIPSAEDILPFKCDMPGNAEVKRAIKMLKNAVKAAGPDTVPAEALKVNMISTVNILHSLFKKIWGKAEVPDEWKEGFFTKLPKSGNLRECDSCRGIMLLSIPEKAFCRILLDRMKTAVDANLRDQQAGFGKDISCIMIGQITTLRIILEQAQE